MSSRCICGAEFCYVCGAKWKTCACKPLDEENLLNQAEEFGDPGGEDWFTYALDNVLLIDEDGTIEWRVPTAAAAEEAF